MAKAAKKDSRSAFTWEGTNRRGQPVKGEMSSANPAMVKAQLRKQGVNPTKVRKVSQPLFGIGGAKKKKIKSSDITFFTRQMATMIKAGVPLVQSFDIVGDGIDNITMKELVMEIRDSVAAGNDFASALKNHPEYFDDLTCNLIESGEQAGALETMLDKVAVYKEKTEALKAKIKKALMYPVITLIVAAVVTAILLIKVVPTFQAMFDSFGAELPAPTQMVVNISEVAQAYWLQVLAVLVVAGIAFAQAKKRSPKFADAVDAYTLKLPVFGDLILKASVARYARVLSTTFAAGVPLVEALDSVAGAVGNAVYRDAVLKIRDEVSSGQQMHFAMKSTGVFPNMVVQMTSIGEESGALDTMLDKAAGYYESEVDDAVDNMTAMIEPFMMAFLGIVIGGLIIAMYLPIFQMGNVV
ncbi:MAG: type II secretion system protein F [Oceanospirillaceae bacterium]|uniref:type II secretion system F family protein n=1 Tax=unclassified Thalassolituus TaxID=2624967 RepID=UPI000C4CD2F2|nr:MULTISPECIES: type II secretion system F family protein [unclassified Thalassolituus]MAS24997.1 type II secretion system protein F [Oceanospirillaceae bacterium]MAX98153.1 type II secretion system protein F [Oceanospirillaceae bacterium]MBS52766.1 type II secretion system protein F [Oceanospirillaceae bacterium]MBS52893.1 type II secretion system protein F [Oceanospirillaceae bacterium]|tara:strand:+ start:638 stop:1873 length:1236 start_codon:yes stop_codon:yes gene_type:complete